MRLFVKKIFPISILLIACDSYAGVSFGNDQFQFSSYGSLASNIGSNFNYMPDSDTKLYGESTINYSNERYFGTLDNLYFSRVVNNNLKIKAGKLKLKDNLDYGASIGISKLPREIYSDNNIKNYDGINSLYQLNLTQDLKMSFQTLYGSSNSKIYGIEQTIEERQYDKILGANTSIYTNYGKTRLSYLEIEPSFDNYDSDIDKGILTSIAHTYKNDLLKNYNEYIKRSFNGTDKTVDSYYTKFTYLQSFWEPYASYSNTIEKSGGTQQSYSIGFSYDLLGGVQLSSEYKKIFSDSDYAGDFSKTGIGLFSINSQDVEMFSIDLNLNY